MVITWRSSSSAVREQLRVAGWEPRGEGPSEPEAAGEPQPGWVRLHQRPRHKALDRHVPAAEPQPDVERQTAQEWTACGAHRQGYAIFCPSSFCFLPCRLFSIKNIFTSDVLEGHVLIENRVTGLRELGVLTQLEELNVAYNCHISDLTLLEWMNLTNLRVLNLEACSNIANRQSQRAPPVPLYVMQTLRKAQQRGYKNFSQ